MRYKGKGTEISASFMRGLPGYRTCRFWTQPSDESEHLTCHAVVVAVGVACQATSIALLEPTVHRAPVDPECPCKRLASHYLRCPFAANPPHRMHTCFSRRRRSAMPAREKRLH